MMKKPVVRSVQKNSPRGFPAKPPLSSQAWSFYRLP